MDPTHGAHITSRLASGALRDDSPVKTRITRGQDGQCAGCDTVIAATQFSCETAFADNETLRFHRDCYHAWHDVRRADRRLQSDDA